MADELGLCIVVQLANVWLSKMHIRSNVYISLIIVELLDDQSHKMSALGKQFKTIKKAQISFFE